MSKLTNVLESGKNFIAEVKHRRKINKVYDEKDFSVARFYNASTLSTVFEGEEQSVFIKFLKEAKGFVKQFTESYIQEDIFFEMKKESNFYGLTLTLSSPGFPGFFIVRIPGYLVNLDNDMATRQNKIIKNYTYNVEYCKKGFEETDPVHAGSFYFEVKDGA